MSNKYISDNYVKDVVEKYIILKLKYLIYANYYVVDDMFVSSFYPTGTMIRREIDKKNNRIDLKKYLLNRD